MIRKADVQAKIILLQLMMSWRHTHLRKVEALGFIKRPTNKYLSREEIMELLTTA